MEFVLPEISQQLIGIGVEKARGQSVAFLVQFDSSGNLIEPKVVARSNYEAMVQVARDTTEPGIILISHQSEEFFPSKAELSAGIRIAKYGLGFGIVSNDGQRMEIVIAPVKTNRTELLNIDRLENLIAPSGIMKKLNKEYEDRRGQRKMLRLVGHKYNKGGLALVEAGTGTGKSLAYLIPAVSWALRNREVSVISTSTIQLQQQLVTKDIPLTEELTGEKIDWALVKGRSNYLSIRRLQLAGTNDALLFGEKHSKELKEITSWSNQTVDGSLSDMGFVPSQKVWDEVKSDTEICLGRACPSFRECFYQNARKRVSDAKLLIVNHHLLLSDASAKNEVSMNPKKPVLPDYKRLIIDETHNIEDVATTHFGVTVTSDEILRVLQRFGSEDLGVLSAMRHSLIDSASIAVWWKGKKGMENQINAILQVIKRNLEEFLNTIESNIQEFALGSSHHIIPTATDVRESVLVFRASEELISNLNILKSKTREARQKLELEVSSIDRMNERILDLGSLESKLGEITICLSKIFNVDQHDEAHVRWIEWSKSSLTRGRNLLMNSLPVESGAMLRETLYQKMTTLVLTSATLTTQGSFDFIRGRLGLGTEESEVLPEQLTPTEMALSSDFDFGNQAILAIPTDLPDARSPGDLYHEHTVRVIEEVVAIAKGGVLVLFTSWESLRKVSGILRESSTTVSPLLVQGEDTRSRLLERMIQNRQGALLGVGSFWEGIDLPGSALQAVIIPRLPFSVPTTPVNAARIERVLSRGEDSFKNLQLPIATLKLKQGFGRLIRSSTDRGAVVILDKRLAIKPYGLHMRDSLPPARLVLGPWKEIKTSLEQFYRLDE